ncbi:MAG: helix-turn-helix domain-containing protein [Lachnospiraceae bacterium]|nr:helix-turn-helix domain-containing protein [Lachnospiraceae bacterium]
MDVYESLEQSLLEAIAIKNEEVPLTRREGMPAETYYVADSERKLIEEIVRLRKEQNISQAHLATMTGYQQQAISRFERKKNSPSLRFLLNILNALGCDLQIVKHEAGQETESCIF